MPKVTFITETLRQYRKKFHELLRQELHSAGIDYQLIYGQASSLEKAKKDEIDLSWGIKIANRYWHFGGIKFCWQPCLYLLKDSDLVIVTQANKLLLNYILMLQRYSGRSKLAFWGHGKNFQVEDTGSLREKFKRLYINQVDWWFAYNDLSAEIIKNAGVSSTKITIVQNAIDTKELIEYKNKLGNYDRVNLRCELGLLDCPIGIFCGGMYKEKRLGFLLEAAELIRNRIKNFQMVFIGEGPDSYLVKEAAHQKPWINFVGSKLGFEKAKYFYAADLFLMPHAVGLAVLDSFASAVPLITTKSKFHGPEISYLENGINGIITEDELKDYSDNVVDLLTNTGKYFKLVEGCKRSAEKYNIENMVNACTKGIISALTMK